MKKILVLILALSAVLFVFSSCGAGNGDLSGSVFTEDGIGRYLTGCYLNVDGVEGESTDSKHDKWIDVIDFDFSTARSEDASRPEFGPFVIVHKVDVATPEFQYRCSAGANIKSITFEKTKNVAGQKKTVFSIALTNAHIISAEITCDAEGNAVETVKFEYETATFSATQIKADDSVGKIVTNTIDARKWQ